VKLLHFSDLHLDAQFAWAGPQAGRKRRENLRSTLLRIVELAQAESVDAVLSGGDLYEHERVTPDTSEFLRSAFARLHPIPVFLAPGNHDWFGPASVYERVAWTPNVHVFTEDRLRPMELRPGLTVWGGAHRAPANTDDFLAGFRVDRAGVNLGLFHAAERGGLAFQESGKAPHAAFDAPEIEAAGLDHAFLGHFHSPKDATRHTYPGNPDPLTFGEDGERGAVIATVGADGSVERRRVRVATSEVRDAVVDVTGAATRQEVRDRAALALVGAEGTVRLTVTGEVGADVELSPADLEPLVAGLDGHVIRFQGLRPAYDLDALADEATVRGQFVRDARAAGLDPDTLQLVIVTGLRALDGRADLEVV
jgi:DNA repair exonuclease SbcCD nuclease subunit